VIILYRGVPKLCVYGEHTLHYMFCAQCIFEWATNVCHGFTTVLS